LRQNQRLQCKYGDSFWDYQSPHTIKRGVDFRNSQKCSNFDPKESNMISREIKKLLQTEKRVTVPALGSFMKRSDGVLLFTDMFKDNDGVLLRALMNSLSLTEQQATEQIARFAADVERGLVERAEVRLTDFGVLSRSADGRVVFAAYAKSVVAEPAAPQPIVAPQPTVVPAPAPAPIVTPASEPIKAEQPKVEQPKPTQPRPVQPRPTQPRVRKVAEQPKKKTDWVLIAAIAAAVVALAIMAYGVINSDMTSTIILE
jgi:nucleoid DNA-binding protein